MIRLNHANGHTMRDISVWMSHELKGEVWARNAVTSYQYRGGI